MDPYRSAASAAAGYRRDPGEEYLSQLEKNAGELMGYSLDISNGLEPAQLQAIIKRVDNIASLLRETRLIHENSLREKGVRVASSSDNSIPITVETIQQTFYNMIPQAIESAAKDGLISRQQINEQEPFIYPGIAALVLIAVAEISKDVPDGIRIIGNHIVTQNNCPLEYKPFLSALLQIKNGISRLSPEEILLLKTACMNNPLKTFPDGHPKQKMIMGIATVINSVASQITQREAFQKLVTGALMLSSALIN